MSTKLLSGILTCKECGKVYDYESRMKVNKFCDCGGDLVAELNIEATFKMGTKSQEVKK